MLTFPIAPLTTALIEHWLQELDGLKLTGPYAVEEPSDVSPATVVPLRLVLK